MSCRLLSEVQFDELRVRLSPTPSGRPRYMFDLQAPSATPMRCPPTRPPRRTSQQEFQRKAEGAEPSTAFRRQQDAYSEQVGKYVVSRLQQLHVVAFLVMMLFSCRAAWLMNDGPSGMTCIMSIFLTSYRVYLHFAGHSESARHTFALVWHLVMMLAVLLRLKSVLALPLDELILSIDRINDVDHSMRQLTHAIVGFVLATSWYGVGSFARMMLAVWTLIAMATGAVVGVRLGDAANLTNTLMDVCLPAVSGYFLGQFIRDELIFALVTRAADKDAIVAELAVLAEESVARGMKLEQARAARKADSRLNHIIKGKCGIAHMSMELGKDRARAATGANQDLRECQNAAQAGHRVDTSAAALPGPRGRSLPAKPGTVLPRRLSARLAHRGRLLCARHALDEIRPQHCAAGP